MNEDDAPSALYRLQKHGVRTKVMARPFSVQTAEGEKEFGYGTILVPLGIQDKVDEETIFDLLQTDAGEDGVPVYHLSTGLSISGIVLGSTHVKKLPMLWMA